MDTDFRGIGAVDFPGALRRHRKTQPEVHRRGFGCIDADGHDLRKLTFLVKAFGIVALLFSVALVRGQDIRIYSEFQRIDPFGDVVPFDRGTPPREILSPAIARDGHLSVHVVVTAPANTNYFLYAAANPADLVD